jgi:hypothetical protein
MMGFLINFDLKRIAGNDGTKIMEIKNLENSHIQ